MTGARPAGGAHELGTARQFAEDVAVHLARRPRQLPPQYLYDALGSALFNAICELPWYGVTRAEASLISSHGPEIFASSPAFDRIVELGAGNGLKLAALLRARPRDGRSLRVDLVDVSPSALEAAARVALAFDDVSVACYEATYEAGMHRVGRSVGPGERVLVLFLGSNIGNFEPEPAAALLRELRTALRPGDALALGADLVKPERDLLLAYDDPLGVTAAFNKNLLVRINRELDADFDLASFDHRAAWNAEHSRVEMHLVSARDQRVRVPAANVEFDIARGESIWTESSYKYTVEGIAGLLGGAGFAPQAPWVDERARFALTLATAIP